MPLCVQLHFNWPGVYSKITLVCIGWRLTQMWGVPDSCCDVVLKSSFDIKLSTVIVRTLSLLSCS